MGPQAGARGSYDRVAPACRGPVARSSTSLCATLTYVTCYVSVVCLRIGTHFVRGLRVRGRPCEPVYVVRPRVLALGGATRERVEDGGEDGGPATGRRTAGGGTAYQQLRARPSPRAAAAGARSESEPTPVLSAEP